MTLPGEPGSSYLSITSEGTRETLRALKEFISVLRIHEIPTGTQAIDWTIPDQWDPCGAQLVGPVGKISCDHAMRNPHIVGSSTPIDLEQTLEDLQSQFHSIPEQPDAIPLVASYCNRMWGFCLLHGLREELKLGTYQAVIDASMEPRSMTFAHLASSGRVEDEIFVTTYVCHLSLAYNELSGPTVATELATWVMNNPDRDYIYRSIFTPESMGATTYASKYLQHTKDPVITGFQRTSIGDDRTTLILPCGRGIQGSTE